MGVQQVLSKSSTLQEVGKEREEGANERTASWSRQSSTLQEGEEEREEKANERTAICSRQMGVQQDGPENL